MKILFNLVLVLSTFISVSAFANNRHCWCDLAYKWEAYYAVRDIKDYGAIHNYGTFQMGANNDCSNRCEATIKADPLMNSNYPGTTTPATCSMLGWPTTTVHLLVNSHVGAGNERNGDVLQTPDCGQCPVIEGTFLRRSRGQSMNQQWTDNGSTYQSFSPSAPPGVLAACDSALNKYDCIYQEVRSGSPDICYGMNHKDKAIQQVSTTYCPSGEFIEDDGYTEANAIVKSGGGTTVVSSAKFDSCFNVLNTKPVKGEAVKGPKEAEEKPETDFRTANVGLKIPTLKLMTPAKNADRSIASDKTEPPKEPVSVYRIEK